MFNVDLKDVLFQLTPHFLRKDNLLKFMFSAIKPLKDINNDGVIVEFFEQKDSSLQQFIFFINNFLNFDARTIYLEKFLNDIYNKVTEEWDVKKSYVIEDQIIFDAQIYEALTANTGNQPDLSPADWATAGIEIVNDNTTRVQYLFNKAEEGTVFSMFNNFDSAVSYIIADFSVKDNKVFKANAPSLNKPPPDTNFWDFDSDLTFIFNFSDQFPFDYRVDIPTTIAANIVFDDNLSFDRIKSQINLLNAAGKTFEGVEKDAIPINQLFIFRP